MYRVVVFLLVSAIFCVDAFGFVLNLYPIRLILPIAFLYSLFAFSQVVFVQKTDIKLTFILVLYFTYFTYHFLHTYFISYIHLNFHDFEYSIADLGNYTVLCLLVMTLYILSIINLNKFYKTAISIMSIFYVLYLIFAFIEIKTGFHLPVSSLIDAPPWRAHIPTVVFHNPNDFGAVFTMMFIFIFCHIKDEEKLIYQIYLMLIFAVHLYILYLTESRLSMLLFALLIYANGMDVVRLFN